MRNTITRKRFLHEPDEDNDLKGKPPEELMGMMWQLTLDAWAFKEPQHAELRLQRHVIVHKTRAKKTMS